MKRIDITGNKYGLLRAIGAIRSNAKSYWMCICDCGNRTIVEYGNLKRDTKSCGCTRRTRNGLTKTHTGSSWRAMTGRCSRANDPAYQNYGGRGIAVCRFLAQSPASLILTIGERPPGKSIDRIDNDGMYSCGKCDHCKKNGWMLNIKWSTDLEQNRNKRTIRRITIGGVTKTLDEWSAYSGINKVTLRDRVDRGWESERLLLKPSPRRQSKRDEA